MPLTLNRKTDYALQLLSALKKIPNGEFLSLQKFSQRACLPFLFLQRVAIALGAAGFIRAERGRSGGYTLARPANIITIRDVVIALEGEPSLVPCLIKGAPRCPHAAVCMTKVNFHTINANIQKYLSGITVKDL